MLFVITKEKELYMETEIVTNNEYNSKIVDDIGILLCGLQSNTLCLP